MVTLKILSGSNAGKEFTIRTPKFLIGRSEECQLRPQSDAISRQHCLLSITAQDAVIQDLGSRNGTFVNDQKLEGPTPLKKGDQLRVGPLKFLVVDAPQAIPAPTAPPTKGGQVLPKRASVQTVRAGDSGIISEWLAEPQDPNALDKVSAEAETQQVRIDETDRIQIQEPSSASSSSTTAETPPAKAKGKAKPGKLPPIKPADAPKNTHEAAAEMLRKFFKRG